MIRVLQNVKKLSLLFLFFYTINPMQEGKVTFKHVGLNKSIRCNLVINGNKRFPILLVPNKQSNVYNIPLFSSIQLQHSKTEQLTGESPAIIINDRTSEFIVKCINQVFSPFVLELKKKEFSEKN